MDLPLQVNIRENNYESKIFVKNCWYCGKNCYDNSANFIAICNNCYNDRRKKKSKSK